MLVGGDFNATLDHRAFRALLRRGTTDATLQAGAGHLATYPAARPWPPLVSLDHVLLRGPVATAVRPARVAGTDHRGLLVDATA